MFQYLYSVTLWEGARESIPNVMCCKIPEGVASVRLCPSYVKA